MLEVSEVRILKGFFFIPRVLINMIQQKKKKKKKCVQILRFPQKLSLFLWIII